MALPITELAAALICVVVALMLGISTLRSAWAQPGRAPIRTLAGWMLAFGGASAAFFISGEVGLFSAVAAFSVAAYVVVAAGAERRDARPTSDRELAAEPDERPTKWGRTIGKSLLAIGLAGVAAVGLGLAFAVAAPVGQVDRIVIGGLLVPMLWGAGMAWTLCDARLLRATALLLLVSACAYAVAFLPKLLGT